MIDKHSRYAIILSDKLEFGEEIHEYKKGR